MITEINIDYYHEIKGKVDRWDEKETGFKPKGVFKYPKYESNYYELEGLCKCEQSVSIDQHYCHNCGQKLKWEDDTM